MITPTAFFFLKRLVRSYLTMLFYRNFCCSLLAFLPFLSQMADRRAFELVVFFGCEPSSGDADSP
jgi:hypothetical protein